MVRNPFKKKPKFSSPQPDQNVKQPSGSDVMQQALFADTDNSLNETAKMKAILDQKKQNAQGNSSQVKDESHYHTLENPKERPLPEIPEEQEVNSNSIDDPDYEEVLTPEEQEVNSNSIDDPDYEEILTPEKEALKALDDVLMDYNDDDSPKQTNTTNKHSDNNLGIG